MNLKSVFANPVGAYSTLSDNWDSAPPDGSGLADVYAWEERRINAMRQGLADPLSYVWVPETSISLSRREAARLDWETYSHEPIGIRRTGGTAVPQGPGTANITLFTRHDSAPDITSFYEEMCAALQNGFETLGLHTTIGARPGSFCDGDYNILLDGKKLAGTAQRWCRAKNGQTLGCHHVVVLTGGDPASLCRRIEILYEFSGLPEHYDPDLHSTLPIDIVALRDAMREPLSNLINRTM
jgi:lipoate-protein ligase A